MVLPVLLKVLSKSSAGGSAVIFDSTGKEFAAVGKLVIQPASQQPQCVSLLNVVGVANLE